MRSIAKTLPCLIVLFALLSNTSFAQYPGMAQVYRNINAQFTRQMMNMNRTYMYGNAQVNQEYDFLVKMKDSSKRTVSSIIYNDTIKHKNYLLFVDKRYKRSDSAHRFIKIYADETISIARNISPPGPGSFRPNYIPPPPTWYTGISADSCWMFKGESGQISAYSSLSDYSEDDAIVGLQLGNGSIIKYNHDNLKNMISADTDAMEAFDKKKYYKAIKRFNSSAEKASKK